MDPVRLRELNMVKEGQIMPAYYGEMAKSCALDRCMQRAKEMIGWDEKYPAKDMGTAKCMALALPWQCRGPEFPVWIQRLWR